MSEINVKKRLVILSTILLVLYIMYRLLVNMFHMIMILFILHIPMIVNVLTLLFIKSDLYDYRNYLFGIILQGIFYIVMYIECNKEDH